jgi:hypothetical protein
MKHVSGVRVVRAYQPSPEELVRARAIPRSACPRRYCWWWQSLAFDWDTPVDQGCTFLKPREPPGWRHSEVACRRCESSSGVDHYQPREPHLLEDGFGPRDFMSDEGRAG